MFHMDQLIRSRRLIRDVTYRWIPFLFVVLTVVISTTLLSTGGRPPRGIVVTFGVLAGLLVVVFLACHLMMYCTRIKHDMDAERASGGKDNDDASVPPDFLPARRNAGTQAGREEIDTPSPRPDERRRQSQAPPSIRASSYVPGRFSAARYTPSPLSQVTGQRFTAYRPQSQFTTGGRVSQRQSQDQDRPATPSALDQTWRDGSMRHSSAVVAPLQLTRPQQTQEPTVQPEPPRGLGPGEPPPPPSRDTAVRSPTPHHHQQQGGQRPPRPAVPDYRPRDATTEELSHGISAAFSSTTTNAKPPQIRGPAVQARLALLGGGGLDIWGVVARVLLSGGGGGGGGGVKRLRRMSADDVLSQRRRSPWGLCGGEEDAAAAEVVVVRDLRCNKAVRVVHRGAGGGLERRRSLRGSVRWVRVRDSGDSAGAGAGTAFGHGGGGLGYIGLEWVVGHLALVERGVGIGLSAAGVSLECGLG
ncbi:hypothetical protein KVR01_011395 [Diaporthe batatas]|uniref:uncharacterized protein n=1 Tax=Diaporthe batatas TaxID=748121 RepID=UPI001D039738|nr:uncharacterized protein KVR01_011395 [Diaporthe batatas]KAG8158952.1 hypothetical protein KVR01_011395 [Diaporthe batatas]